MIETVNFDINGFTYYRKKESVPDSSILHSHTHDNLELYYFLSGDAVFYIEGNEYKISPGDIFIIKNSETHYLKLLSEKPYERIVLNFPVYFLDSVDPEHKLTNVYFGRKLGSHNKFNQDELGLDFQRWLLKIEKCDKDDYIDRIEITLILSILLLEINKHFTSSDVTDHNDKPKEIITQIISYVNENITSDLSPENIAEAFFISKSYLNRIFKSKTGFTVWNYIITKRLILAKDCISNGMPSMKACEFVGFKDYSTFYRRFIKHFGFPPKETGDNL